MHFVEQDGGWGASVPGWVQLFSKEELSVALALATWRTPGAPTSQKSIPPIWEHPPGPPLAST